MHAADEWDVAMLFDRLAKERPAQAQFHERKYLSLLTQPVESSGELAFTPPDRLEKRTISPNPETVVVDRRQIILERGGRKQTLELAENPGIAVLVESIRATLAGDLASLSRAYSVQLSGHASRWRLVLRPRDTSQTTVERIEINGAEAHVREVVIFQADGDRSVMTISSAITR
ncbi:MAG TPA: outer membrane lipoprotein carrier protein LolA [Casimicrobiaceae bacterium]|nr:outer membrane lipoprotein carrier protein LolA [Casimicrobiaceae bacterium]